MIMMPKTIKNTKLAKKLHPEHTVIDNDWIEIQVPYDILTGVEEAMRKGLQEPVILVNPKQWQELCKQAGGVPRNPKVRLTNYIEADKVLIVEDNVKWFVEDLSINQKKREEGTLDLIKRGY